MVGPGEGAWADAPEALAARERVLERMDVRATNINRDMTCRRIDARGDPCPEEDYSSVVVSLPMPGEPCWPGMEALTDPEVGFDCSRERKKGLREGHWWVRIVETAVQDGRTTGMAMLMADLVLERGADGEWRVVDESGIWAS